MESMEPLRIFIGTDESQTVAHRVLEHSIRKHASIPVEITPMFGASAPLPVKEANQPRTGFSFTRFKIPELCGYHGRALYLDADMLVFGDIAELARLPFDGKKLLCTFQPHPPEAWKGNDRFHRGRNVAVMLLDCARLAWNAEEIVNGLDKGLYTYEDLVHRQCLVEPDAIADTIPIEWNHLERYEPGVTKLLHFTVVHTQPWKNSHNPLCPVWMEAFAEALQSGSIPPEEVEAAIAAGYGKRVLADLLELTPDRDPADPATPRVTARKLALAQVRIAELEHKLAGMERSRSWRIGSAVVGALRAPGVLLAKVRATARESVVEA